MFVVYAALLQLLRDALRSTLSDSGDSWENLSFVRDLVVRKVVFYAECSTPSSGEINFTSTGRSTGKHTDLGNQGVCKMT
jgi:hypothetical protein